MEFKKNLQDVKPDAAVDVVVLRKGKKETIKGVKLPEAKAERPGFGGFGAAVPSPAATFSSSSGRAAASASAAPAAVR